MDIENKALLFAIKKHGEQLRTNGELYILHPIRVVEILKSWGIVDSEIIAAAYLHDVIEDTNTTLDEINKEFSESIGSFVNDLSFYGTNAKEKQKWLDGLANKCLAVRVIKMADRISNTWDFIKCGKQKYANKYLNKADKLIGSFAKNKNYNIVSAIIRYNNDIF